MGWTLATGVGAALAVGDELVAPVVEGLAEVEGLALVFGGAVVVGAVGAAVSCAMPAVGAAAPPMPASTVFEAPGSGHIPVSIRYSRPPTARMSWSGVALPWAMTCDSRTWPSKFTRTSDGLIAPSAMPLRC